MTFFASRAVKRGKAGVSLVGNLGCGRAQVARGGYAGDQIGPAQLTQNRRFLAAGEIRGFDWTLVHFSYDRGVW
ncbi:MAG TPA: hypothetical protein VFS87_04100 [Qipengyuania sp.]|nr:hypothetical protein [Qipengyuania sp.]